MHEEVKKFMRDDDVSEEHAIDLNDLENFVHILHHRRWRRESEIVWRKKESNEKSGQAKMSEMKCAQKERKEKRESVRSERWIVDYIQR